MKKKRNFDTSISTIRLLVMFFFFFKKKKKEIINTSYIIQQNILSLSKTFKYKKFTNQLIQNVNVKVRNAKFKIKQFQNPIKITMKKDGKNWKTTIK